MSSNVASRQAPSLTSVRLASSPPVVTLEHVSLAFDDDVVLRDVSFSVAAGDMAILIGASGAGKSVILKLILGLLKPDAGIIRVNGQRIDTLTERQLLPRVCKEMLEALRGPDGGDC